MNIPEKWYIVRNEENANILNEWENNRYQNHGASLNTPTNFYSDRYYDSKLYEGYTEISFALFKQYILNINYEIY